MIKTVLVLGSRHSSMLPQFEVSKVYTANAAAKKAIIYKNKYPNVKLKCCTTGKEFNRNSIVRDSILEANPDELIFRLGKVNNSLLKNLNIKFLTNEDQKKIQSNFYKLNIISLYLSELRYRKINMFQTIKYFFYSFLRNEFLGASTGLFTTLLAINENEDSDIIISGIGLDGGPQFYNSDRAVDQDHSPRGNVDKYIIKNALKPEIKKKIKTLDLSTSKMGDFELWGGNKF